MTKHEPKDEVWDLFSSHEIPTAEEEVGQTRPSTIEPPPPEPEPVLPPVEQADLNGVELPPYKAPTMIEMHATALVFLDDPLARRLAVAWVSCHGDEARWLEAAGIEPRGGMFPEANRLTTALRINGICRDGGVTDQLALRYISTIVAKQLTPPTRKEKP